MSDWIPTLPGMGAPEPGKSHIEESAIATIQALTEAELLEPRHAITCQLVLELARSIGHGLQFGKVTVATATLTKHLLDAIDSLPKPPEVAEGADEWEQFQAELVEATRQAEALAQGDE